MSFIAVFLVKDLDFLCACRTAPAQSWKNPVERVMSTLNLGLQSVGLIRKEYEKGEVLINCNSVKQIRAAANNNPGIV